MSRLLSAVFVLVLAGAAQAAPPTYPLGISKEGGLSGAGAEMLHNDISRAQFILYGEDHGFADSPVVLRATAHDARPLGFNDLIVEVGPSETEILAQTLARDGVSGVATLVHSAPLAIPFLCMREDAELATDFVGRNSSGVGHLRGIDQEFVGAPALLLKRLIEIAPNAAARDEATRLLAAEMDAQATAAQNKFLLFSMSDASFGQLEGAFRESSEAERIVAGLRESAAIYQEFMAGRNYESNARRSALLRANFLDNYRRAREQPKFIFKMGADHLGMGMTPNNTFDPGTLATSIAALNDKTALRILFLPIGGTHTVFAPAGGNPFHVEIYDDPDTKSFFAGIGVDASSLRTEEWTLIPLAPIRAALDADGIAKLTPFARFLVLGYDYVITTPDAKPATPLY